MKELSTMLGTILRNKAALVLTTCQVALTLAVLVNSYASIDGYRRMVNDEMGIAQDALITVTMEYLGAPEQLTQDGVLSFYRNRTVDNLDVIRSVDGIEEISLVDGFPLSDAASVRRVHLNRDDEASTMITMYTGDEHFVDTLGLHVTAGRSFDVEDTRWVIDDNIEARAPFIIISQDLAERLFPNTNALSQQVFISDRALTIIGVVESLPGLHPLWSNAKFSALIPGRSALPVTRVMVKADVNDIDQTIAELETALTSSFESQGQIVTVETLVDLKRRTLNTALSTLKILGFVSVFFLLVTALGSYGQTAFIVTKRAKETGIKRAIGATRGDVLSYFLIENWIVTTVGVVIGFAFAYMLNFMLVQGLGATKIHSGIVIPGIIFVWLVGLLSAFLPAWRAARVAPAAATRMV